MTLVPVEMPHLFESGRDDETIKSVARAWRPAAAATLIHPDNAGISRNRGTKRYRMLDNEVYMSAESGDDTAVANGPDVLTYDEAARLLRVSKRTLQRLVRERRVPHVELPARGAWRGVRFLRADLVAWLHKRTVKPMGVDSRAA